MMTGSVKSVIKRLKLKAALQIIFGSVLAVFNGLAMLGGLLSTEADEEVFFVIFLSVLTALGILLMVKGRKKIRLIKNYYDYSARLDADPTKSIALLASSTGVTVAAATKNISEMIVLGFFPGCCLDEYGSRLVTPNAAPVQQTVFTPVYNATTQNTRYVTVQCKGCGAINKIIAGSVGECEFCGSKISE